MTVKRIEVGPRMSQAVVAGGMVYLAGQVALDRAREILERIDRLLAAAGTDKSKLVTANIWLSDIATFQEMNSVWDTWVDPANTPARATVESKLAAPQFTVEIAVTAAI
jgi:enamine deaminase RidA (YjgF/YER057c/UK114 family)